jgi:hypothetical protein
MSDKKLFYRYSRACSEIIFRYNNDISLALNPVLHVTRHYGPFVKLVDQFFDSSVREKAKSLLRFILRFSQALLRVLFNSEARSRFHEHQNNLIFDVVIISHADRLEYLSKDSDFYFGQLHRDLLSRGFSVCHLYTNKRYLNFDNILQKNDGIISQSPKWILRNKLNFSEESYILWDAFKASMKGFFASLRERDLRLSRMLLFLCARSYEVIPVLRIRRQIFSFCIKSKPRFILHTFEGHAWERAVAYAAREAIPEIVCAGYQHSAVFPVQFALRASVPEMFRLNWIFCSGIRPLRYLQLNLAGMAEIKLLNSGAIKGVISSNDRASFPPSISDVKRVDLIALLSGEKSDYCLMVDFLCLFSIRHPGYRLQIRPHPLSLEECHRYFRGKRKGSNIELSAQSASLETDLTSARFALYSDSTAIAFAMRLGCYPLFFALGKSLSVNSLHLLFGKGYTSITTMEHLQLVLSTGPYPIDCLSSADHLKLLWDAYSFNNVAKVFEV